MREIFCRGPPCPKPAHGSLPMRVCELVLGKRNLSLKPSVKDLKTGVGSTLLYSSGPGYEAGTLGNPFLSLLGKFAHKKECSFVPRGAHLIHAAVAFTYVTARLRTPIDDPTQRWAGVAGCDPRLGSGSQTIGRSPVGAGLRNRGRTFRRRCPGRTRSRCRVEA